MINQINKYLNNEITIEELVHYFDKNNYTKEEIKNNGIVYTPKYICDYIIEKVKPKLNETIFEPSIGHGIFIFSILEYIEKTYNLTNIELKKYFLKNVFGQDFKEQNIIELKEIIVAFFKKRFIKIEPKELNNFYIGDTLFSNNKIYDIIIGNPPYIRSKNLDENYLKKLQKEYKSCSSGNIDIYYAFIEYAYKNSNKCAFIIPNSWLYNNSATILRNTVKNDVIEIIDFKEKRIFKNAATYVSIFIIDKQKKIEFIEYKEKITNNEKDIIKIKKDVLNDNRWILNNNKIESLKLKTISFKTPIATLRDKIFITKEINTIDMISFYKISKIKSKADFFNQEQKIIFPYNLNVNDNKFNIKKDYELNIETLIYLNNNKEELNKRDKGKTNKYEDWFAYGRKQGFNTYNENKSIIIVPGMISKDFVFFSIELKEIKQPFLFSNGFILEVEKSEEKKLLDFLNSDKFKKYFIDEGKVWKGNDENSSYYSLSIKQLKNILK